MGKWPKIAHFDQTFDQRFILRMGLMADGKKFTEKEVILALTKGKRYGILIMTDWSVNIIRL